MWLVYVHRSFWVPILLMFVFTRRAFVRFRLDDPAGLDPAPPAAGAAHWARAPRAPGQRPGRERGRAVHPARPGRARVSRSRVLHPPLPHMTSAHLLNPRPPPPPLSSRTPSPGQNLHRKSQSALSPTPFPPFKSAPTTPPPPPPPPPTHTHTHTHSWKQIFSDFPERKQVDPIIFLPSKGLLPHPERRLPPPTPPPPPLDLNLVTELPWISLTLPLPFFP